MKMCAKHDFIYEIRFKVMIDTESTNHRTQYCALNFCQAMRVKCRTLRLEASFSTYQTKRIKIREHQP